MSRNEKIPDDQRSGGTASRAFRNWLGRVRQKVWGKALAIFGGIAAVAVFIAPLLSGYYPPLKDFVMWLTADEATDTNSDDPVPESSPDVESSGRMPAEVSPTSPSVLEPGACLADPADLDSVVACNVEHRAEVVSTAGDECNMATVVQYAGGDPETDLLSDVVRPTTVSESCVVQLEGNLAAASLEGALTTGRGDGLRECLDGHSRRFVPCSESHTGEVVARVDAESADSLDCDSAAAHYLGQGLSERYSDLEVEEVASDSARRCVVSLRSDTSWLETPLRNLGNAEIQTSPM